MMAGLNDFLEGVESVSPADEVDDNLTQDPEDELDADTDDPSADSDDEGSGEEGEGKGGKSRTPENIYREVSRKQDKMEADNRKFQEKVFGTLERITENLAKNSAPAEPDNANGDALSKYSVTQLKELRAQVPDEKREAFDEYVIERMVQDKIEARMSASEQARDASYTRKDTAQRAVDQFPDLLDTSSEFAKTVDRELRQRGKSYAENNPHALLDVASSVAVKMGIGRRAVTNPRLPVGGHATRRNAAPNKGGADDLTMSRERANDLASRLEGALPKGKKFNIDSIRKSAQEYSDNADLFIR